MCRERGPYSPPYPVAVRHPYLYRTGVKNFFKRNRSENGEWPIKSEKPTFFVYDEGMNLKKNLTPVFLCLMAASMRDMN